MIRDLSKYARRVALGAMTALALLAGSTAAKANDFMASPQDYPTATAYAQAYAQAAQDLRDGKRLGYCYGTPAPGSYNYGKCFGVLTAMERKVGADSAGDGGAGAVATGPVAGR